MSIKRNTLAGHYKPWHKMFASAGQDQIGSYIVKDVCINNPATIKSWAGITEEACYCMLVVLLQYGLCSLAFVI